MTLNQQFSVSTYLSNLLGKTSIDVDLPAQQLIDALDQLCLDLEQFDFIENLDDAEAFLITQKRHFVLYWAACCFNGALSQPELGDWQARFAEQSIEFALRYGCRKVAAKQAALQKHLTPDQPYLPGLFVFGMGKLGGRDLNFSSDVDLVAYFDPQVLPVPDALGKSYICHQILQAMTKLLGQNNSPDFIWRVDWRLRPNASATTLAMSTAAAHEYYYYRASPWHRLALLKARVVAGDRQSGNQFIESLTPFLWRQNLDYRALDELAEIKQKINLEHPALRAERKWRDPIADEIAGFNVKLGRGGIREIEFIANALQLVWGGKHYSLRTANTLQALQALAAQQHLDQTLADQLSDSYQFLRKLENAIQMSGNQHTHLVPVEPRLQENLLVLLGQVDWDTLVEQLNGHRRIVNRHFEDLFADQGVEQHAPIHWPDSLSESAQSIVDGWENGFHHYGVSNQTRHRLLPLARALSAYLDKLTAEDPGIVDSSATVMRLHDYFRSLPRGEQYFRLLAESPMLLENIIEPLLHSPAMSHLLKQSPHIIDCYMQEPWRYPEQGFDANYVLHAEHYEERLERLRRFVNEYLYQLYLWFIQGELAPEEFQHALSDLAEYTLQITLLLVNRNLSLAESPIAILGLGKVGLRRMSPTSDLDLVFIYDADVTPLETASRYVSRLQTAISTPMREGIVYELDTRLRPSGRSGAPTVSAASFAAHQLQRAHTWEHIALAPGRVIAGDPALQDAVSKVRMDVLSRQRDDVQFLRDARKMWQRIAEHRVESATADVMFSKLREGGLMQSEYLASCLVIRHSRDSSALQFDDLLAAALPGSGIENLAGIIQFWRIQQLWERLLGKSGQPLSSIPSHYLELLLQQSGVANIDQLIEKKQDLAQQVQAAMQGLFAQIDDEQFDPEDWHETSVCWADQDV